MLTLGRDATAAKKRATAVLVFVLISYAINSQVILAGKRGTDHNSSPIFIRSDDAGSNFREAFRALQIGSVCLSILISLNLSQTLTAVTPAVIYYSGHDTILLTGRRGNNGIVNGGAVAARGVLVRVPWVHAFTIFYLVFPSNFRGVLIHVCVRLSDRGQSTLATTSISSKTDRPNRGLMLLGCKRSSASSWIRNNACDDFG